VKVLALWLVVAAAVVAGCGSADESSGSAAAPPPPRTLQPADLPELTARARTLGARELAGDAFEPAKLAALLHESGFVVGSESEFSGHTDAFDHVLARTLRFAEASGAQAYLSWLSANAGDLLGKARLESPVALGQDGVAFSLVRCGTCKKELPTLMAAWRRDDVVGFLLAAGRGADRERFGELARRLDARISP
jgi:hypothetical protein